MQIFIFFAADTNTLLKQCKNKERLQATIEYIFAARFIDVLALNWQRARLIADNMDEKIPTTIK